MGSCTRRHFLLSTCFLQMITIIERQVFDFLGYMWAPIMVNFFHIIFIIFGFYGAYHFRVKYIITYLIWNFIWIGWNAFLICFYLNVGTLDRDSDTLNLGTGSFSWFEVNGYGCKPIYPTNITTDDPYRPIRPERVDDCLLDYPIIEIIHSGVQCALAFFGILGAILISYIFLDEDDRFDFMNGDAKSPQHTVVHPMYVSYSSIPTSASATLLSNKHQHHNHQHQHHNHQTPDSLQRQQQQYHHKQKLQMLQTAAAHSPTHSTTASQTFNNNNTFLIHANSKRSSDSLSNSISGSNRRLHKSNNKVHNVHSNNTTSTKQETLTRMQQYQRQLQLQQQQKQQQQSQQNFNNYDDSTAKADQIYNSQTNWPQYAQQVATPTSSHENTTSSLSYASLQNSNATIATAAGGVSVAGTGTGIASPFNHSNFSLTSNSINNNTNTAGNHNSNTNSSAKYYNSNNNNSAGRFARIHGKPKPPKSSSYSSFISNNSLNGSGTGTGGGGGFNSAMTGVGANDASLGSASNLYRPDIKYTQMSNDRLSSNYEEAEDDNFSLRNFKADGGITYVPFQKPTPVGLFINTNNINNNQLTTTTTISEPSPHNTNIFQQISPNNNTNHSQNHSNSTTTPGYGILLERGAILQPALLDEPALNPLHRYPGTPSPAYRRRYLAQHPHQQPTRPTNIPLPVIPSEQYNEMNSPLDDQMPSPPPPPMSAPRPHIFQPRSGHAPYPDLSPEVTERYAMPTQYIPRSPVVSRIARRQRQQSQESSKLAAVNSSANFCDQIRDTPPACANVMRAKSHDRLSTVGSPICLPPLSSQTSQNPSQSQNQSQNQSQTAHNVELAPHVNRRSGRRSDGGNKARPRSYCNSMNGEDVIRGIGMVGGNAAVHAANYPAHIV